MHCRQQDKFWKLVVFEGGCKPVVGSNKRVHCCCDLLSWLSDDGSRLPKSWCRSRLGISTLTITAPSKTNKKVNRNTRKLKNTYFATSTRDLCRNVSLVHTVRILRITHSRQPGASSCHHHQRSYFFFLPRRDTTIEQEVCTYDLIVRKETSGTMLHSHPSQQQEWSSFIRLDSSWAPRSHHP